MGEERRSGMSEVLKGIERIHAWQDKHSGEGDGTTHSLVNKRLDYHATAITRLKTVSGFIGVMWALTIGAMLRKFWS